MGSLKYDSYALTRLPVNEPEWRLWGSKSFNSRGTNKVPYMHPFLDHKPFSAT